MKRLFRVHLKTLDVYQKGIVFIPMEFEFDPAKSKSNKAKHDIDFVSAQSLWKDLSRLEIPALSLDEPRFQVLGLVGNDLWSAFITYRKNKIRIISVRRARGNEEKIYYGR